MDIDNDVQSHTQGFLKDSQVFVPTIPLVNVNSRFKLGMMMTSFLIKSKDTTLRNHNSRDKEFFLSEF